MFLSEERDLRRGEPSGDPDRVPGGDPLGDVEKDPVWDLSRDLLGEVDTEKDEGLDEEPVGGKVEETFKDPVLARVPRSGESFSLSEELVSLPENSKFFFLLGPGELVSILK